LLYRGERIINWCVGCRTAISDLEVDHADEDGSLYYIGGAGINYQRLNGITLAPIRLGVGLRAGASVGYIHYRREKSINPF
ncbi:MAG: DUF1134 domain-containing protein, partial [Proteobacteria bacterium]|nr:DUF1134 domain-containing protein [Pseudomonadota bacterium]